VENRQATHSHHSRAVTWLESQLFAVTSRDPAALALSAALLAAVAVVAHWFPTRRAMRIDPAVALRDL
jgi:hypothetical protein